MHNIDVIPPNIFYIHISETSILLIFFNFILKMKISILFIRYSYGLESLLNNFPKKGIVFE